MRDLGVSVIQTGLVWHNAEQNRIQLQKLISRCPPSDLIVLPEMFTSGFTMKPEEVAESQAGETVQWMCRLSADADAALCGSFVCEEDGSYFNRLVFVEPDGAITRYDKRHLFRMANEHHHYTPGTERVVVYWRDWRILLGVCYDLRFPVWSRNRNDYDLAIYVANWPERRRLHWKALLPARAIENLSYIVGVNRIGTDGNGVDYSGDSAVYDMVGGALLELGGAASVERVSLSAEALRDYRARFPAHLDADRFELVPD